jgi:hypothetical protein
MARPRTRVCSRVGCPNLHQGTGRCPDCEREAERLRGTPAERGYDAQHRALRKTWAVKVKAGGVRCWRCGEPIAPTEAWDLGHDDEDRTVYRGPEHAGRCNRAAGARKGNAGR